MFEIIPRTKVDLSSLYVVLDTRGLKDAFVRAFAHGDNVLSDFVLASTYDRNSIEEIILTAKLDKVIGLCRTVAGKLTDTTEQDAPDVTDASGNERRLIQLVKLDGLTPEVAQANAVELRPLNPEKVAKRIAARKLAAEKAAAKRKAEKKNSK